MPAVVSDSSTLMHLAAVGHLALLREYYGTVTIPPAVWTEVVEQGGGRSGAAEVRQARTEEWIVVVTPTDAGLVRRLRRRLGPGEAEGIALAVELRASLILLDESRARTVAEEMGLRKTGVVGILLRARREGRIHSLRQEFSRLRLDSGFRLADDLVLQCLQSVGEEP